jgi:hypothetical protein
MPGPKSVSRPARRGGHPTNSAPPMNASTVATLRPRRRCRRRIKQHIAPLVEKYRRQAPHDMPPSRFLPSPSFGDSSPSRHSRHHGATTPGAHDRQPPRPADRVQSARLLLSSPLPLAARHKREYQRVVTSVLSQRHRPQCPLCRRPGGGGDRP